MLVSPNTKCIGVRWNNELKKKKIDTNLLYMIVAMIIQKKKKT